jgi:serine/threonine protein kinase
MQLSCGDILAGRYEVERALGSGGMAEVWRVRHLELGSAHALKLLHRVGSPDLRRRLLEEGRAQAQLSHPNIVRVTDVVQLQGSLALVMELVEGPSLRDLLDEGRPPLAQAAALGAGLLAGVAHAHAAGFIHRDLKPENVLLTRAPPQIPRVADFGLVRALEAEASGRKLTREQVAMGTPGYMPPEQYRDAGRVDASADVFALGCVLYELLTGRRVFQGGDLIALYQSALREDFAPPGELAPELPPALCALVAAALSARPERRPSSAVALHAAWLAATGGSRCWAPAAPARRAWRWRSPGIWRGRSPAGCGSATSPRRGTWSAPPGGSRGLWTSRWAASRWRRWTRRWWGWAPRCWCWTTSSSSPAAPPRPPGAGADRPPRCGCW